MVYGDAMEWMERFARKGRRFDVVIVDPPSSSTSRRGSKRWVAERDLHGLVQRAADLYGPGGPIFVSTNLRSMSWERFDEHLAQVHRSEERRVWKECGSTGSTRLSPYTTKKKKKE